MPLLKVVAERGLATDSDRETRHGRQFRGFSLYQVDNLSFFSHFLWKNMCATRGTNGQAYDSSWKISSEHFLGSGAPAGFRTVFVDNIVAKYEDRVASP